MTVAAESKNGTNGRAQGYWFGMTPKSSSAVIQNVVENLGNNSGLWHPFPEPCYSPNVFLKAESPGVIAGFCCF
jgi:hypothetical protein